MRLPKGILQEVHGYMLTTSEGKYIALNEVDHGAIIERPIYSDKLLSSNRARELYNKLYKLAPK